MSGDYRSIVVEEVCAALERGREPHPRDIAHRVLDRVAWFDFEAVMLEGLAAVAQEVIAAESSFMRAQREAKRSLPSGCLVEWEARHGAGDRPL